jgi:DNA-binding LacI/PurR family transcriptional regulator
MPSNRVTLRQIALKAGVHVTTVSLALRGSPKLPVATRTRLKAIADQMGYTPDATLAALNAYRKTVRVPVHQATVGFITNFATRQEPHTVSTFHAYFMGAMERATELGYILEEVWLREPNQKPETIRRMLQTRGIEGLLIAPQPAANAQVDLAWEEFSAVTFGYSLARPQLHLVTNHQYRGVMLILKNLRALGYRRIGMYISEAFDARVNYNFTAAYRIYDAHIMEEERVPLMYQGYLDDHVGVARWLDKHKPEVVIASARFMKDYLTASGRRVPEDVGLALLDLPPKETELSGVYQNDHLIGRAAFDFLVAMLQRRERGVPAIAQRVLIDSVWLPGRSVRRVGPAAPWFMDKEHLPYAMHPARAV